MNRRLHLLSANALFWFSTLLNVIHFLFACRKIKGAQQKLLLQIVSRNKNSEFGRKYSFEDLRTPEGYMARVPIMTYEDFVPYIDTIAHGGKSILTKESIYMFESTSGSSSASKLIPYTASLRNDFRKGIDPWIFSLYCEHPRLFFGSVYWSLTPSLSDKKYTDCGIPIGASEDSEYFGTIQKWVLDTIVAVPPEINKIKDIETFRYCTLLFLLARRDVRLISVWNPTYLVLLLKDFSGLFSALVSDLRSGRVSINDTRLQNILERKFYCSQNRLKELELLIKNGQGLYATLYEAVWPELEVISCWTDGTAGSQIEEIRRMFPRIAIQPKGLIATEMFVSFPFFGMHSLLSLHSHFFEFEELGNDKQKVVLAHELRRGIQYKVIVTTGGGFYRYAIGDIVEVVDFWNKVPLLRFIGRGDKVVDLVGEKLNEFFVEKIVTECLQSLNITTSFWMVAPERLTNGCYRYVLFLELSHKISFEMLQDLGEMVEKELQKNYHYCYARKLGQLVSLDIFLIESGDKPALELFMEISYGKLGQKLGTIKLARLHRYENWAHEFHGYYA